MPGLQRRDSLTEHAGEIPGVRGIVLTAAWVAFAIANQLLGIDGKEQHVFSEHEGMHQWSAGLFQHDGDRLPVRKLEHFCDPLVDRFRGVWNLLMESLAISIDNVAIMFLVGSVDADEQARRVGLLVHDFAPSINTGT